MENMTEVEDADGARENTDKLAPLPKAIKLAHKIDYDLHLKIAQTLKNDDRSETASLFTIQEDSESIAGGGKEEKEGNSNTNNNNAVDRQVVVIREPVAQDEELWDIQMDAVHSRP